MQVQTVLDVPRHHRERMTGIEPAFSAWEADVLPLNYIRKGPPHTNVERPSGYRPFAVRADPITARSASSVERII
jgi:hypothetical protein